MSDGIDYNTLFASLGAGGSVFTIVLGSLQLKTILRARRLRHEREERAKAEKNKPRPGEMHGAIYIPTDEEVRRFKRNDASFSMEQKSWPALKTISSRASDLHINIIIALLTSIAAAVVANDYFTSRVVHYSLPELNAVGPGYPDSHNPPAVGFSKDYDAIVFAVEIYFRTEPDDFIITSEGYKLIYNGRDASESIRLDISLHGLARHMYANSVFFEITHYLHENDETYPESIDYMSTPDDQRLITSIDLIEQRTRIERDDLTPRTELLIRNLDE